MCYGRGGHYEHRTSSNVLLLHCIVGPYIFTLYMMFHLNAGDDNDVLVGYDTVSYTHLTLPTKRIV